MGLVIRRHVIVSGRVQGVGYRFATRSEAERLGVLGWVRNLPDGRVEADLEGEDRAVDALLRWMEHGPTGAHVSSVETAEREPGGAEEFAILR